MILYKYISVLIRTQGTTSFYDSCFYTRKIFLSRVVVWCVLCIISIVRHARTHYRPAATARHWQKRKSFPLSYGSVGACAFNYYL